MSDYKEYRPKTRIPARILTDDVKVLVMDDGQPVQRDFKAGDYEIRSGDGSLTYASKADFESANEPVRRERQAKALTKKKAGNQKDKDKALPAAQG